jgi:hypothetical protein
MLQNPIVIHFEEPHIEFSGKKEGNKQAKPSGVPGPVDVVDAGGVSFRPNFKHSHDCAKNKIVHEPP